MNDPKVRLAARAVLAGLAVFVTELQASNSFDWAAVRAAAVAAVWAGLEYFTPLNKTVGKT